MVSSAWEVRHAPQKAGFGWVRIGPGVHGCYRARVRSTLRYHSRTQAVNELNVFADEMLAQAACVIAFF
jgi:hypothetical protein